METIFPGLRAQRACVTPSVSLFILLRSDRTIDDRAEVFAYWMHGEAYGKRFQMLFSKSYVIRQNLLNFISLFLT